MCGGRSVRSGGVGDSGAYPGGRVSDSTRRTFLCLGFQVQQALAKRRAVLLLAILTLTYSVLIMALNHKNGIRNIS